MRALWFGPARTHASSFIHLTQTLVKDDWIKPLALLPVAAEGATTQGTGRRNAAQRTRSEAVVWWRKIEIRNPFGRAV